MSLGGGLHSPQSTPPPQAHLTSLDEMTFQRNQIDIQSLNTENVQLTTCKSYLVGGQCWSGEVLIRFHAELQSDGPIFTLKSNYTILPHNITNNRKVMNSISLQSLTVYLLIINFPSAQLSIAPNYSLPYARMLTNPFHYGELKTLFITLNC